MEIDISRVDERLEASIVRTDTVAKFTEHPRGAGIMVAMQALYNDMAIIPRESCYFSFGCDGPNVTR